MACYRSPNKPQPPGVEGTMRGWNDEHADRRHRLQRPVLRHSASEFFVVVVVVVVESFKVIRPVLL